MGIFLKFREVVNWGVPESADNNLQELIRLCNVCALIVSLGVIPFVLYYAFHQLWFVFATISLVSVVNAGIPFVNRRRQYTHARVIFFAVNFSVGFINSTVLGQASLIFLYMIVGLPASVALFRPQESTLLYCALGFVTSLLLLDLVFDVVPLFEYQLSETIIFELSVLSSVGSVACLLVFVVFFRKEGAQSRRYFEQIVINSQIINSSLDAILFCDLQGRINFVNVAAEKLYGFSSVELNDKTLSCLMSWPMSKFSRLPGVESAESWTGEELQMRRDGSTFVAQVSVFIVKDQVGSPVGMAVTSRDITDKKQIEADLIEAKNEAEKAASAKAQFLATMSHEIRTPLNGVIGISHHLLEDHPKPEHVESLNVLNYAAENLLSLVNDVLDFSKMDAGRLTIEKTPSELDALLEKIKGIVSYQAQEKGVAFELELDCGLRGQVFNFDANRLTQILLNLIGNALKFTDQGMVSLRCKILGSSARGGARLQFEVSDTGIGIAQEKQELIFDLFSQADNRVSRTYGGTGLGLAIVRRLLHAMGSDVTVTSQEGFGSSFGFVLEFESAQLPPQENADCSPSTPAIVENTDNIRYMKQPSLAGIRVLVAEDNPVNVMVVSKLLNNWGVKPDIANNGKQAISLVRKNRYDIILMDLHMPILDGFTAVEMIRHWHACHELPIIALSASVTEEFQSRAKDVGMNDYITKPFNPEVLKLKMVKHLQLPRSSAVG
ncbi:MAG: ATP-binding protein [Pseudomonadales bacterium]|nr:ATP-binding protein [Pseudomonadales bacterium]